MTGVRSARIENLALPIRGFNTELPPHLLPPEFSPWITNFDSEGYYFAARKGINFLLTAPSNFVSGIVAHPRNVNKVVFVDTFSVSKRLSEYDVTTNTTTSIGTIVGANATAQVLAFNYERHSYFFYPNTAPSIFDGTTFSNMSITGPTAANVIGGCVYRNRLYLFESNSGSSWYANLPRNTSGTFIEFPMAGSIQQAGVLSCIFSVTTADTALPETFLGGFFNTGEVVLFRGAYPGSADWQVAGVFQVGTPLSTQSYINVEGDIWLLTYGGITSVRQLINGIAKNKITANIGRYWETVVNSVKARSTTAFTTNDPPLSCIRGAYHQGKRKVIITIPGYVYIPEALGTYTFAIDAEKNSFLTYDLEAESWIPTYTDMFIGTGTDNESFITPYYWSNQNKMILGSNNTELEAGFEYWSELDFLSDYGLIERVTYDLELQTSFTKSPYIGKINSVFVTHEGEVNLKRDSQVKYIVDFGASETGYQGISQSTPAQVTRDQYNIQAQGNSFSVGFKSTCEDEGYYNLYGMEILKEDGKGIS